MKKITMAWNEIYKQNHENYKYYNLHEAHENLSSVAEYFKQQHVRAILDLGCGVGRNLIPLVQMGFEVSGIDYANEAVKDTKMTIQKAGLSAGIVVGDMHKTLPYRDNSFDALISVQVIQHGYEPDVKHTISEIHRVVKPDGHIFITVSGRISNGKIRPFLVKTAEQVDPHTFIPVQGNEKGQVHFIYTKDLIMKHFTKFEIEKLWKDSRDYYCFIAKKK